MLMPPERRVGFAQRVWERPEAAVLHDAAEAGDVAQLRFSQSAEFKSKASEDW